MAYFSGNAAFFHGRKRSDRQLDACSMGVLSQTDQFNENFGFKFSDGGAISLYCSSVSDQKESDYLRSSSFPVANYTVPDVRISDAINDLIETSVSYRPYKRSADIIQATFQSNHAGRQGSAIYAKGLTSVLIESSRFTSNKAVDVL